MNISMISGNLGADPTMRSTQSGKKVANFNVAVRRRAPKDSNGNVPTDWISVTAWDSSAEFSEKYLKKGSRVLVSGRLQTDTYEKDGQKHSRTYLVADNIEFAGGKPEGGETKQETPTQQIAPPQKPAPKAAAVDDDDIPF